MHPCPRVDDVEVAVEFWPDEHGVVFGGLGHHAVASVGAHEVESAGSLSQEPVQRGGRFREGDDVDVSVVVVVHDGGFVHADANDREVVRALAKIKAGEQRHRLGIKRWWSADRRGVGEHPNAVLVAGENVGLAVAVVIAEQAPIDHGWPTFDPVPPNLKPVAFRQPFKQQQPTAVPIEREQVVVAIQVGIDGGPLWRGQAAHPRIGEQDVLLQHLERRPREPFGQGLGMKGKGAPEQPKGNNVFHDGWCVGG